MYYLSIVLMYLIAAGGLLILGIGGNIWISLLGIIAATGVSVLALNV